MSEGVLLLQNTYCHQWKIMSEVEHNNLNYLQVSYISI
jgi:hypothetical protein